MADRIFFNPGDSIANINDYQDAVRQGQLWKNTKQIDDLVIAKGADNEEYAIFYAKDAKPADHASHPNEYEVKKKI